MRTIAIAFPAALALAAALAATPAAAQEDIQPAARAHVRMVNGVPIKYSSKLTKVVELNFTFGFYHSEGKQAIDASLDRIAKRYALGGKDAFTVRRIASSSGGSAVGEMVNFTLADLLSGEVIVNNNISAFDELQAKGAAEAKAIENAVKVEGRGVLGFHGSGDGGGKWKFYAEEMHPVGYQGHGARIAGLVYKNSGTARHLILQGLLEKGTVVAEVPMGVDASGNEVLEKGVKARKMTNEWYRFSRNMLTDPVTKGIVTPLLKYDPRDVAAALDPQYRYKGGNLYTFLLKAGAGKITYLPAGHVTDELTGAGTSFDGGTGDLDRYVAQTLFYLAGYKTEVCAAKACECLPIVGADEQLTGETMPCGVGVFDASRPAYAVDVAEPWQASLVDISGRVVARRAGKGKGGLEFDRRGLEPGIYFFRVKVGDRPLAVRRYVLN